jgi:hypothetical protein
MSDREAPPTDLFDAICRLDDLADWLQAHEYLDDAADLRRTSEALKGYIEIRLVEKD